MDYIDQLVKSEVRFVIILEQMEQFNNSVSKHLELVKVISVASDMLNKSKTNGSPEEDSAYLDCVNICLRIISEYFNESTVTENRNFFTALKNTFLSMDPNIDLPFKNEMLLGNIIGIYYKLLKDEHTLEEEICERLEDFYKRSNVPAYDRVKLVSGLCLANMPYRRSDLTNDLKSYLIDKSKDHKFLAERGLSKFDIKCALGNITINLRDAESTEQKKPIGYKIFIEGNIGCGKSSFLNSFRSVAGVEIVPEPIDEWQNLDDENGLQQRYEDPAKNATIFQFLVLLTLLNNHIHNSSDRIQMRERSIFSVMFCFTESMYKNRQISKFHYLVLKRWFEWNVEKFNLQSDVLVYLRSDPLVCYQRMTERNRPEEKMVQPSYLELLHSLYEDWIIKRQYQLFAKHVIVIDADQPLEIIVEEFKNKLSEIGIYLPK